MQVFKFTAIFLLVVSATVSGEEEEGGVGKSREKRQQIAFYPRRGPRPPPYAVQMEPIVQYSQRDPLYNPLASAKSDDSLYAEDHGPAPIGYYQNEPEPIIEIIIKESNESLPTPAPPPQPPQPRPTKEPIQVFYVKYEKKKGHGDDKPRVVYDTPIPALTPVEEHDESPVPEHSYHEELNSVTSPAPPLEPSTTLRTVIRPDSEVYHAGSSGIRVTFGTEQVPPNQHNKRSDRDQDRPTFLSQTAPVAASKRQHGPYQPLQPVINSGIHRFPPALAQQRVINSFPPAGNGPPQSNGGFLPQLQFQQPQLNRNPNVPLGRPQRLPITIQGLPEIQQRVPFNSFNNRAPGVSQQQPISIQNGFGLDHQQNIFKQQELEKQRYYEQRRQQDLIRQQEQNRQRDQVQQRQQQEQIRIQEQQRRQQEIEQKQIQEQQRRQQEIEQKQIQEQQRRQQEIEQKQIQEQQFRQQQAKYNQFQQISQQQYQIQQSQQPTSSPGGEILKAVPKLEQHYAIRENPLHPGPFPPNPTQYPIITQGQFGQSQQPNAIDGLQSFTRNRQTQFVGSDGNQQQITNKQQIFQSSQQQQQQQQQQHQQQHQQQFFSQNLPVPQQQQLVTSGSSVNPQSIWESRPVFSRHNSNSGQKIYATPVANFGDVIPGPSSTTPTYELSTTVAPTARVSTTTEAPSTTTATSPKSEAKIQQNIANLPDEVPDDIREQLLSSGILGNADIQILDYDKVGDIPIENLPPEALANFYGAGGGGAAAAAASEPVPAIVKRPKIINSLGEKVASKKSPKVEQATLRPGGVEMKVVHFDPNTAQGQAIADQHIREDATHLDPVKIGPKDSSRYNRYLPLKVSGAAFPLPDVPELNGRKITSVVVLAPVDYNFQGEREQQESQITRGARKLNDVQAVRFLAGDALKQVVKKPNAENYKKWLEQESRADPQRQSVVLLVTTPEDDSQGEKEIFMYDVTTQAVSKLAGDLSTAFVDVAESNSGNDDAQTDIQDSSSIN